MPKKKWVKPQLIVLIRGKPDENVLIICKQSGQVGSAGTFAWCISGQVCEGMPCEMIDGS